MMNPGQYQEMLDIWNEQTKLLKEIKELLTVRKVEPAEIAESVRRELDLVFTSANDGDPKRRAVTKPIVTKKPTKGN